MTAPRIPHWVFALLVVALLGGGIAISRHWLEEPALTRSDYVGTIEVSVDDAKLYRAVPFEWRITGPGGSFKGTDTAYLRIDSSSERTVICGWLQLGEAGASIRASRWLSEARLTVGTLTIPASFIAAVQANPGDGLNAGCAGLYDNLRPAADAALALDGPAVHE